MLLVSAFLLATSAVPAALADDPPQPTTTVIATSPTPDPPPPVPKPKPKPKPTPQPPAQTPPRQFSPPSTPSHAPAVVHVTKPVVKKSPPRQHVKPKKAKRKAVAKPKPATVPTITVTNPAPAAAGLQTPTLVRPDGSTNVVSLLILLGLSFAIVCLGIAVVPAPHVPWRPAAIFVSERQVDLTVIGAALLLAAALTLFWTGA